jgi:D-arabinose 1-dehydrogenase-like Zn-dependent alcohol dehydrogenase
MKAVQLVEIGNPLKFREIPMPAVASRDVLVRVEAAGICHSDVHYRAGKSPVGLLPQTLGHEVAGVVEKTGSGVVNVRVGDRVCLHSYTELLGKEAQIIGCSDHLRHELPLLLAFVRQGKLDLSRMITKKIPLEVDAVNNVLDALDQFKSHIRVVIKPNG